MEKENTTDLVLSELKNRLYTLLGSRLKRLVLFGSRARGDWDRNSDIDIAVIVEGLSRDLKMRILDEVADVELEHLQPLSTLILSEETFAELLQRERRIALDIKNEGVPI